MNPKLQVRLLASIQASRLVILCGAGLSMAPPSSLPSAAAISNRCFERYRDSIDASIDPSLRNNLEGIAEHAAKQQVLHIFISSIVPWDALVLPPPNSGHQAIADFLICRAVEAALSANYDRLIEKAGEALGADLMGATNGLEAIQCAKTTSPLLKFHGCSVNAETRAATVWASSQLEDNKKIKANIKSASTWMAANLIGKDLVLVGFWTDWSYLNKLIFEVISQADSPASVTVVDPSPLEKLIEKAPGLSEIIDKGIIFEHVELSGADFLNELRIEFSLTYFRKFLSIGRETYEAKHGAGTVAAVWMKPPNDMSATELYQARRDLEGRSKSMPAITKEPDHKSGIAAYVHLRLMAASATRIKDRFQLGEKTIRVVNGAGQYLDRLKAALAEPPASLSNEYVICAGAENLRAPSNVVRQGRPADFIRPETEAVWADAAQAFEELGI